jgi:hypothetical protein
MFAGGATGSCYYSSALVTPWMLSTATSSFSRKATENSVSNFDVGHPDGGHTFRINAS